MPLFVPCGLRAEPVRDVPGGHLHERGGEIGERGNHHPHERPPAHQVGHQGHDPQPQQCPPRAVAGHHRVDGQQEVLREQLRVGQAQGQQTDPERRSGQQLGAGGVHDGEHGHDPEPHVDPAEQPRDDQRPPRAVQPVRALLDGVLELLDQLVLEGLVRAPRGTPCGLTVSGGGHGVQRRARGRPRRARPRHRTRRASAEHMQNGRRTSAPTEQMHRASRGARACSGDVSGVARAQPLPVNSGFRFSWNALKPSR